MHPKRILLVLSAAAALAACSDGPTDTPPPVEEPPAPGIHFVAGQNASDTIDALVSLVVEVRDGARNPAAGQEVVFQALGIASDTPYVTTPFGAPAPATTDAGGRVTVGLKLGQHVGAARLVVRVPALGYVDTARFTVKPGRPVKVGVSPRDSTVYVGNGYTVAVLNLDRYGNQGSGLPTTCSGATGAVSAAGCALRGERIGRGYVVASTATRVDTAWVSVVPEGVVAAYDNHYPLDPENKTVLANLDGSGLTRLGPGGGGPSTEAGLAWSPDGQELALVSGMSKLQVLRPGSPPRDLIQPPSSMGESAPRYARDGSTVFFTANDLFFQSISLYRARRDGTSPARFGPPRAYAVYDYDPSPSPDGRYVAYVSNRDQDCSNCGTTIRVWDLQQDTATSFRVTGELAAWSPVGDLIAYASARTLRVIHADGTGDRQLPVDATTPRSIDWSPDGRWLLITTLGVPPRLIEVSTGLVLPIAWAAQFSELTWRP
jgi:dipeptidyl aminopeptidase/acylaminoacyl peptidase